MKYMTEFRLKPGMKDKAVEAFERRGPNRYPGVTFEGAWVGKRADIAFVLVSSDDEAQVAKVAESWSAFGEAQIYPVLDVQQF